LRYFFHIGYHGANYNGWQKLPNVNSIEAVIENTLSAILKQPVSIVGCGRTDTGVHAAQFFFHLDIETPWDFDLLFRLNKNLPPGIAVFDIIPMDGTPHARLDAVQRNYDYFAHTYKDPFLASISSQWDTRNLDIDKMRRAMSMLPKHFDYRAFCKNVSMHRTTICKMTKADILMNASGDRLCFRFSADRFLTGMVRIIVQKLFDVGIGELSPDEFEYHLKTGASPKTIIPAAPNGLYLSKVVYPFLELPTRTDFVRTAFEDLNEWSKP